MPRPEPSDNVNLANHQALIDAIDNAAETPAGAQAKADAAEQAAKAYTDAEVGTRATKTEFNAHVSDNVRHITASERSAWNAKETPAGAQAKVDAHANVTSAHGATSAATANRIVMRDGNGRAAVANPVNNEHIANKQYVDGAIDAITSGNITIIPSIPNASTSGDSIPTGVTMFTISSGSTGYFYPYSLIVNFKTTNQRLTQWCFKNGDVEDGAAYRHWYSGKGWSDWFEVWDSKSLPNPARRNIDNNFISQTISGELRLSGRLASTVLPNSQIINQSASNNRIWVGNPQTHLRFESDGDIDASITGRGLVTLFHTGNQGNPNNLNTSSKQIVGAINELFTTVSDGKQAIRDAIADAGGTAPSGSPEQYTHQDLANAIDTVSKYASGTATAQTSVQIRGINFEVDVFRFAYQTDEGGLVDMAWFRNDSNFIRKVSTSAADPVVTPVSGGFDITLDRPNIGASFSWNAWGGSS